LQTPLDEAREQIISRLIGAQTGTVDAVHRAISWPTAKGRSAPVLPMMQRHFQF
jgi:hypothetical protein